MAAIHKSLLVNSQGSNDPTIQVKPVEEWGEKQPTSFVGTHFTPFFERFPLDRWIVGSLGIDIRQCEVPTRGASVRAW
jgi:hypothetical protein